MLLYTLIQCRFYLSSKFCLAMGWERAALLTIIIILCFPVASRRSTSRLSMTTTEVMTSTGCNLSSHVELLTQQPPRLRRPLPSGRLYHFTVIYNHAQSSLSRTEDTQLARAWTELAVEWLQLQGLVNTYYHDRDCPQGQGLVKELSRVLAASEVILLLLTPSFVRDCWPRYCLLKSFNSLFTPSSSRDPVSSSLSRVIPVALGLEVEDLPALIKPVDVVCFQQDFQQDIEAWDHLTSSILSAFPGEGSIRENYFGRSSAGERCKTGKKIII